MGRYMWGLMTATSTPSGRRMAAVMSRKTLKGTKLRSNRPLALLVVVLLPILSCGGCGGQSPAPPQGTDEDSPSYGIVHLVFHWPGPEGRLIPTGTDRIEIQITAADMAEPISDTVTSDEIVDV